MEVSNFLNKIGIFVAFFVAHIAPRMSPPCRAGSEIKMRRLITGASESHNLSVSQRPQMSPGGYACGAYAALFQVMPGSERGCLSI